MARRPGGEKPGLGLRLDLGLGGVGGGGGGLGYLGWVRAALVVGLGLSF